MMRRFVVFLLAFLLLFLAACGSEEEYDNELTEREKLSLNIEREKSHFDEVFALVKELDEVDFTQLDNGVEIYEYDPADFVQFILPEAWVNEVTYTISKDKDGEKQETLAIIYTYRDHNIIVDYFSEGFIRKAMLNQETGYVIMNENDENFSKFHRDQLE